MPLALPMRQMRTDCIRRPKDLALTSCVEPMPRAVLFSRRRLKGKRLKESSEILAGVLHAP